MATLDPLQRAALEQAALWRARLNADAVGDADRQAWQTWHDAHEQHRWAWQQVAQVQQRLGQLPAGLAGRALDLTTQRAAVGRRGVLKGMLLLAGTAGLGWAGYREVRHAPWAADYHTRVGKRQALTLADGTQLELNTDTALDVRFDSQQRLLVLRQGEVMITSAPDQAGRRCGCRPPTARSRHWAPVFWCAATVTAVLRSWRCTRGTWAYCPVMMWAGRWSVRGSRYVLPTPGSCWGRRLIPIAMPGARAC
ncbi:DUF4880 domain-containing protein [Pseudomonas sp. MAFF212427]|uniref:DUF4880 domain-containing protein n=1 Tax=Pseudomonas brassicae TaxID=2708063 RepID=A0A6B3NN53_9PSED|nr:FecR domain-containing protein [Pseudomonas brassicae]NER64832.1 DUF4880 domain-containing protein [Pseudomonas brassicae]